MAESKWNPDRARRLLQELGLTRRESYPPGTPWSAVEPSAKPEQPHHQENVMNTPAANPRFAPPHAEHPPAAAGAPRPATSVLGPSLRFKGELAADEDLLLQGQVEGSIEHSQSLTIGTDGGVKGNIRARIVIIDGSVEGDVHGLESVTVRETARVRGNIFAPRVGLADGAKFTGRIDMESAQAAAVAPTRPAANRAPAADHVLSEAGADKVLNSRS
jgi:cytoskeletal protein CcmA (bactofilin family)